MSSKNSSPYSNKKNTNHDNNSSFNPLIEGLTLAQSSAMALITISSEILEAAPKMIDQSCSTEQGYQAVS